MFPPRALGHVFELLQIRTQSTLPSCSKESWSWISSVLVFKLSFAFWQTARRMLAGSSESDSSAVCQNTRGSIEPEQTMKLYTTRKHSLHTLTPFIAEKTYLYDPSQGKWYFFCIACNWIEMVTAWAACFSQEIVALEEARPPSSETTQKRIE